MTSKSQMVTGKLGFEMATVAERVQAGIDLLDAEGPRDWRDRVVLSRLDVEHTCRCVLGFVFDEVRDPADREDSGFRVGCQILPTLRVGNPSDYGFDSLLHDADQDEDFRNLQAEWSRRLGQ